MYICSNLLPQVQGTGLQQVHTHGNQFMPSVFGAASSRDNNRKGVHRNNETGVSRIALLFPPYPIYYLFSCNPRLLHTMDVYVYVLGSYCVCKYICHLSSVICTPDVPLQSQRDPRKVQLACIIHSITRIKIGMVTYRFTACSLYYTNTSQACFAKVVRW